MFDRAFQEYKKVFDLFPDSGRVGEAVAKMANYYYQQKDYARAIDTFESVLQSHPDAKFLDVILFNYGRCLYRMDRKVDARKQFDHLIHDFPESPLAADAKKISEQLRSKGFSEVFPVSPLPGTPGEGSGVRAKSLFGPGMKTLTPDPSPGVPGEGRE